MLRLRAASSASRGYHSIYLRKVSKGWRKLLLDPTSSSIWKVARRHFHYPVPDLESPDVAEASIAFLLFGRTCFVCGKERALKVDYQVRVRCCLPCFRSNTKTQAQIRKLMKEEVLWDAFSCLPPTTTNDAQDSKPSTTPRTFFLPFLRTINSHLKTLKGQARCQYVQECKSLVAMKIRDGRKLAQWEAQIKSDRTGELQHLREKRKEAILVRMNALGYTETDVPPGWFTDRVFIEPKAIDDEGWETIKDQVVAAFAEFRCERRAKELVERQATRRKATDALYDSCMEKYGSSILRLFPTRGVFYELPAVQRLWKPEAGPGLTWQSDPLVLAYAVEDIKTEIYFDLEQRKWGEWSALISAMERAKVDVPENLSDKAAAFNDYPKFYSKPQVETQLDFGISIPSSSLTPAKGLTVPATFRLEAGGIQVDSQSLIFDGPRGSFRFDGKKISRIKLRTRFLKETPTTTFDVLTISTSPNTAFLYPFQKDLHFFVSSAGDSARIHHQLQELVEPSQADPSRAFSDGAMAPLLNSALAYFWCQPCSSPHHWTSACTTPGSSATIFQPWLNALVPAFRRAKLPDLVTEQTLLASPVYFSCETCLDRRSALPEAPEDSFGDSGLADLTFHELVEHAFRYHLVPHLGKKLELAVHWMS
ncbi:hypothetical protein T439DRAFT_242652 [Meredithblackwellia eburnea MCA 4105]